VAGINNEGEVNTVGNLKIGSCPRCNKGEVFLDRDQYGWYECCLQCGYTRDLPDIAPVAPDVHESAAVPAVKTRAGRPGRSGKKT
jgi:hypothetical protein